MRQWPNRCGASVVRCNPLWSSVKCPSSAGTVAEAPTRPPQAWVCPARQIQLGPFWPSSAHPTSTRPSSSQPTRPSPSSSSGYGPQSTRYSLHRPLLLQLAFPFCPLRQDPSAIVSPSCRRSLLGTRPVPLSVVGSLLARGSPTLSTLVGLARPGSPCLPAPPPAVAGFRPFPSIALLPWLPSPEPTWFNHHLTRLPTPIRILSTLSILPHRDKTTPPRPDYFLSCFPPNKMEFLPQLIDANMNLKTL